MASAFDSEATVRVQACARCWRRKQKCDRLVPRCTPCALRRLSCVQRALPRTAGSGPDGPGFPQSEAASKGFVTELEQRLNELRMKIRQNVTEGSSITAQTPATSVQDNGAASNLPSCGTLDTPSSVSEQRSIQTSLRSIGSLSLTAMSEGRDKAKDSRNRSAYITFVKQVVQSGHDNLTKSRPHNFSSQTSLGFDHHAGHDNNQLENHLLGFDASRFLDLFLTFSARVCPCVDEEVAVTMFKEVREAQAPDEMASMIQQCPEKVTLVYLMTAAGICLSGNHRSGELVMHKLTSTAGALLPIVSLKAKGIATAQCLVVSATLSTYYPEFGSAWHLLGLAMVECLSLVMHSKVQPGPADNGEGKEKRNLFWSLFVMDRSICLALGRPFTLSESDITVEPPLMETQADGSNPTQSWDLQAATIAHALLMTDFRCSEIRDLRYHISNHDNWRDRFRIAWSEEQSNLDLIAVWEHKHCCRLQCRAWVELITLQSELNTQEPSLTRRYNTPTRDIYRYLQILRTCTEVYELLVSIIDVLDAFAGVIAYMYLSVRQHERAKESSTGRSDSIDDMTSEFRKITSVASDVLTSISFRFSEMRLLRETLRTFVTLVEVLVNSQRLTPQIFAAREQELQNEVVSCGNMLPINLQHMILITVKIVKHATLTTLD
ncbi:hypothetical protein BX600DRAFT_151376 [Xylariales sp. PMI_506]|nr:hypothetical protein BX600DRAFT_151376 [Xylariales sp. PMI_506]